MKTYRDEIIFPKIIQHRIELRFKPILPDGTSVYTSVLPHLGFL